MAGEPELVRLARPRERVDRGDLGAQAALVREMRQDLELPFGKQSVFFNGQGGWMASPQGTQNLPPPLIKQVKGELFREIFGLALSDRDADRTVNAVGDNELEISDKVKLELRVRGTGEGS